MKKNATGLLKDPTEGMNEEDAARWKELDKEIKNLLAEKLLQTELKKKSFEFMKRRAAETRLVELNAILSRLKKERTALEKRSAK